jgi:hypothetical protein
MLSQQPWKNQRKLSNFGKNFETLSSEKSNEEANPTPFPQLLFIFISTISLMKMSTKKAIRIQTNIVFSLQ